MTPETRIGLDDLVALIRRVFVAGGMAGWVADILARNCAICERDGSHSHGTFRVPGYLASLRAGWVDGRADPVVDVAGPSLLRVDGRNGFAQPALARAGETIAGMLGDTGLAVVLMRDTHHFSALWPDLEPWAERGFVGITAVTGGLAVLPFGARQKLFGTNPIAFATPVAGQPPLVFDFATSAMSHGDIRLAARAGRPLPEGTGLGRGGRPTTDADEVLQEGGILPFGGHKGAALSLMVEVLASALAGGLLSKEVDWTTHPGAETPRTGQFLMLIDPVRGGNDAFASRVAGLLDDLVAGGADRLPGQRRLRTRQRAAAEGIPLSENIREVIRLAEQLR